MYNVQDVLIQTGTKMTSLYLLLLPFLLLPLLVQRDQEHMDLPELPTNKGKALSEE
jgi:hypothetical protein